MNSVVSPCIDICTLDEKGQVCLGCLRTIHEIASWSRLTDDERKKVMAELEKRRARRSDLPSSRD